jgi:hypothetical protein
MTRYAAFVVLFPLALFTIYFLIKSKKHLKHLPLLLLVSFVLLLPHFIIRSNNSTDFLNHSWLQDWSLLNAFKSSFITVDGISNNSLPNILYAFSSIFHPRYLVLGPVFLFILFKLKPKEKYLYLVIISYLFYSVFLAGIPFQNSRFLVLSFPLLIIILYPSFDYLSNLIIKPSIRHLTFVIIAIIQSILCFIAFQPVLERNRFEKEITEKIEPYQNNTLYSFDIDIAMQGRGLNFNYMNLWVKEYKTFEKDAHILFHPTRFNKQWKDKNPILNWDNLNKNYNLKIIEELPEGWKLYEIQNKKKL